MKASAGSRQTSSDTLRRQAELGHHRETVPVEMLFRDLAALELEHEHCSISDLLVRGGNRLAAGAGKGPSTSLPEFCGGF